MPGLPDHVVVFTLPIDVRAFAGFLGLVLAWLLAGSLGKRSRPAGPAFGSDGQALVLAVALGGGLGAHLVSALLDPSYAADPAAIALQFPTHWAALTAGGIGSLAAGWWLLSGLPDYQAAMDQAVTPLMYGIALAALGWPHGWVQALLFAGAGLAVQVAAPLLRGPGDRMAVAAMLAVYGLVLAELLRLVSAAGP